MSNTEYGDITPRTAAHASKDLLERGIPYLVFEKFGQTKPLAKKNSKVEKFRRYESLDATPAALTEGVTPAAKQLSVTDVTCTLVQYGDLVTITDVIIDTHEDPVLNEATDVLGEQAAQLIETTRFNILKAGTNVQYANGSARTDVNTVLTLAIQRKCTRTLKRNNAKRITKIVKSTPSYGTASVAPAFVGVVHPDCENDIRDMTGFVAAENYGSMTPWENEIGKVEDCRYVTSTIIESWADGGAAGATMIGTTDPAAAVDVYPVLYIARDAYGIVPLKGANALTPMVSNPKPSDSDPLAQRGHVAWKSMQGCVILNDDWMIRAEVSVLA